MKNYKIYTKNVIALLLALFMYSQISAQTDVQISYFMNNELSFNPSFAGANEGLQASLLARQQWIGFDKAPATQTFHADYQSKFGGIGMYVINDGLGYESSTHAKLLYAYKIDLAENTSLSAGLGAGIYSRKIDGSEFIYQGEEVDPNGVYGIESNLKPTFDLGVHLSHKNMILGFSATHLTQSLSSSDFVNLPRHYYGYFQYEYDQSEKLSLVPTVYVKSGGYITQVETNCNAYFNNKFWLGATYRFNESAVFLAGLIIKEKIKIGYAYDFSVGAVSPYSDGNHEIILSVRFGGADKIDNTYYQSTRLFN